MDSNLCCSSVINCNVTSGIIIMIVLYALHAVTQNGKCSGGVWSTSEESRVTGKSAGAITQ